MVCCHVLFSAHVQLFFKPSNSAVEGSFGEENHAVFTRLNEAYLFGSKDGNIRYALCVIYQLLCDVVQNGRMQEMIINTYGQIGRCNTCVLVFDDCHSSSL